MKKFSIKKLFALILTLALYLGTIPLASIQVSAASSWLKLYASSYCEFTATKTIYVYRDFLCRYRGTSSPDRWYNAYIESENRMKIIEINSNYLKVQYGD